MDRPVHYFALSQKLLSFSGLWHTQPKKERLLRYCVIGFMSIYTLLGESCQLLASSFDLQSLVRLLQVFVVTICGSTMYLHFILQFKTIQTVYSYIVNDWQRLKDDAELKIMKKFAHYSNIFTFTSSVILYTHLIITVTSSLLRISLSTNEIRSDQDLYPIISCFDYFSKRGTYYYPIIIYQILTSFAVATASAACYSKYMTSILHACACLSIIKYKICSPFISDNHNDDIPITSINLSPWIIDIVKRLSRTTEYVTLVNKGFERIYLVIMFLGLFLVTLDFLCIPILLERKTVVKDVLAFVIYISGTLSTLYVTCYAGQKLMDYSTDVYREASLLPFHQMSLKTQKLLLITLMMSSKPHVISIGKVYVASHEFFSNLLRSSLSFAMVVHSLQAI